MNERIKQDIIDVLNKSITLIETEEHPGQGLTEVSDHIIHDASLYQDEDSVSTAVLIHALSKIVSKCCEKELSFKHFANPLKKMREYLVKDNAKFFREELKKEIREIQKLDEKLKVYVQEVLERAKIKKGSKMHEHGISIARTAEILGISQWELQQYIGVQKEFSRQTMPVRKRLEIARELFL